LSGAAVLWAAALYQREAMMDKDQEEALLIAVAAVRRRARDIMELCKKDDMSNALSFI
jgi:PHD/YefM family antitoxin component YafN of YafNO toxin-antitoxin module